MPGAQGNLSLLSRGIGEVKKNGHEKVDVVLEPEDYYNYTQDAHRIYLPPIQPKYNTYMDTSRSNASSAREIHELYLPKTFMTRKGALLLFSEDFANKTKSTDYRPMDAEDTEREAPILQTVEDLSKSILSYGSRKESEVSLFVYDKKETPRKIRPGFSAKRYLSRLTRSFDESFLDKLLNQGYVNEKTIYHNNVLMPHLRHRINDDLSGYPMPYRIMKQMLMAPGILSGYTFYTGPVENPELSMVMEEDEEYNERGRKLEIIDAKDGVAKSVSYSDLSKEEKEQVLADLLVKSAINQALEKQKEVIEREVSMEQPGDGMPLGPGGVQEVVTAHRGQDTDQMEDGEQWTLDMAGAVKSYIDSQVTTTTQEASSDTSYMTPRSFRGSKIPAHSVKSFEANPFEPLPQIPVQAPKKRSLLSDTSGHREYVGGVPIASLKDTQSVSSYASSYISSSSFSKSSVQDPYAPVQPVLSPIMDVNSEAYGLSRETSLNPQQPVPPIKPSVKVIDASLPVPGFNIQPPTPQTSNLTKSASKFVAKKPAQDLVVKSQEWLSEKGDDTGRSSVSESASHDITTGTESDSEAVRQKRRTRKRASRSMSQQSLGEGGSMIPSGGPHLASSTESVTFQRSMRGGALKKSKASSVTSSRRDLSDRDSPIQGTIVYAPGGEAVKVGESLTHKHELQQEVAAGEQEQDVGPEISVIRQANRDSEGLQSPTKDADFAEGAEFEDGTQSPSRHGRGSETPREKPSSRAPSVASKMSGYTKIRASTESLGSTSRKSSKALSEQELVEALSEHAHRIAESVLSRPETGVDLVQDAQAVVTEYMTTQEEDEATMEEYKEMLKDTLATVVSKISGEQEEELREAEVSPDLVEALANQEIAVEDIEITKDEDTGKTVIRAKSVASYRSSNKGESSRRSSRQSIIIDVPTGEVIGVKHTAKDKSRQQTPSMTTKSPSLISKSPSKEVSMPIPETSEETDDMTVEENLTEAPTSKQLSRQKSPRKTPSPTKSVAKEGSLPVLNGGGTFVSEEIREETEGEDEAEDVVEDNEDDDVIEDNGDEDGVDDQEEKEMKEKPAKSPTKKQPSVSKSPTKQKKRDSSKEKRPEEPPSPTKQKKRDKSKEDKTGTTPSPTKIKKRDRSKEDDSPSPSKSKAKSPQKDPSGGKSKDTKDVSPPKAAPDAKPVKEKPSRSRSKASSKAGAQSPVKQPKAVSEVAKVATELSLGQEGTEASDAAEGISEEYTGLEQEATMVSSVLEETYEGDDQTEQQPKTRSHTMVSQQMTDIVSKTPAASVVPSVVPSAMSVAKDPSIVSTEASRFFQEQSLISVEQSALEKEQSVATRHPSIVVPEQTYVEKEPSLLNNEPSMVSKDPSLAPMKEQTVPGKDPSMIMVAENSVAPKDPSLLSKSPTLVVQEQAIVSKHPTQLTQEQSLFQEASTVDDTKAMGSRDPTLVQKDPTLVTESPIIDMMSKANTEVPTKEDTMVSSPDKKRRESKRSRGKHSREITDVAREPRGEEIQSRQQTQDEEPGRDSVFISRESTKDLPQASREATKEPSSIHQPTTDEMSSKEARRAARRAGREAKKSKSRSKSRESSKLPQTREGTGFPPATAGASLDERDETMGRSSVGDGTTPRIPSILPTKSNTQVSEGIEAEPSTLTEQQTSIDQSREPTTLTGEESQVLTEGTDLTRDPSSVIDDMQNTGRKMSVPKKPSSIAGSEQEDKGDLGMDVINYGEADKPEAEKSDTIVRPMQQTDRRRSSVKSGTKSQRSGKGAGDADTEEEKFRKQLEELVEGPVDKGSKSVKSGKSGKSAKTKTPEAREEFVVGKPKEEKEMEKLYAPIEPPPKPTEKKPRVPKPEKPKKKTKKKTKKDEKQEEKKAETPAVEEKAPTPEAPAEVEEKEVEKAPEPEPSPSPQPTPSPEPEVEEDMEFVIVRDEFEDDEPPPPARVKSVKSFKSLKSAESRDTDISEKSRDSDLSGDESALKQISNREARAAKRAAQAAKKREEMERKRRDREDKLKLEREELERKEQMNRELEEERRKQEENRRLKRAKQEEETRRQEEEERRLEERKKQEQERERRLKEDYKRRMEEMKMKQMEEEVKRKELEEQKRKEEEERRIAEQEMLAKMEEEERLEYERRKAEEEELKRLKAEADRIRREAEAAQALEEAKRLAEEMARKQLELERRMAFNRSLQLESTGLSHTQEVTRAFVWSYYELLKWLGLDVPEFEKWKATLKY